MNLFRRPFCHRLSTRPIAAVLSATVFILCLFHAAPLIGESDQARAVKEYHTAKIRSFERKTDLNLIDPLVNVKVGASYLAHLKEMFGDLKVALTAYNSGPTWVSKRLAAGERLPLAYASKVLTTQRTLENRLTLMQITFPEVSATGTKDHKG